MPGLLIPIGGVGIDVIPNATGIYARLASQMLPDADRVGRDAGRIIGDRIRDGISGAIPHAIQASSGATVASATQQGNRAGGAFGQAMRRRLEAALRSLPDIRIDANTSEADADIQALRVRLESLRNQRIGIDIDAAAARAEATDIEEQLRRLGAAHPNVQMRVDTAAARAALVEFRAELDRLSRTSVSPRIEVEGGFAQRLRVAVEAAQAQLPDINVGANTSHAVAEIQSLRGQLEALRTVRVGIDIDAATALARINEVQARLTAISASNATADVRVDAATAAATLATIQAQVNALDGDTARIDVDVSGALSGLVRLSTLAAGVGPALVPAFAAAAYGVGAFTSVLSAATIGVGLFAAAAAPGLIGVGKAIQATTQAQDALAAAQDKTARTGAAQAVAAQQQALAMAGAQASLAAAQRNAAQQVEDAQERVADAALRVVDAQERVADAERAVADARQQAAVRMDAALDRITDAERQRTDAVRDARRAELALIDARRAAQEQLEDLNARVEGGAVAERRAVLSVKRAQKDLEEINKQGSDADADAAAEAQLSYDEAVLRLKELQRENKRSKAEADAANAAGVKGAKQVLDAQQGVLDAKSRVVDADKAIKDAQNDARKTQVEGARAVAKAQEGVVDAQRQVIRAQAQVADAEKAVSRARVQGAEQVASAQRQVTSAQLAAAAAAVSSTEALSAANTAVDKQKRLLEGLTPAQRGVYDAVQRLKEGFKAWGDSLAPATMPLVTRFLDGITASLPGLTPLVIAAAEGFERLFDRAGKALEDPFWDRFKANLVENLPRAIESMGVVFGNVFAGMAGVINAFLPQTDAIADSMEGATASFREWGQGLETSEGFASFREFLREDWPGIKETFADVGGALWQITRALAEISPSAVLILQGVATAIENTPVWLLQALIDAFFAYKAALVAVAIAQGIYSIALGIYTAGTAGATVATWSFTTAIRAIPMVGLILTILTLIGTFVLLMIQSEAFRNKVVGALKTVGEWGIWLWEKAIRPAFDGITGAAMAVWDKGIRPAFGAVTTAIAAVGTAAMWLWDHAIEPAFEGISLAARVLAAVIITLLVAPVVIAFNILAPIVMALWENVFQPAFEGIGKVAGWLWDTVLKPILLLIGAAILGVGVTAMWLWEKAFQPAIEGISTATSWLWTQILQPTFGFIWGGLQSVGDKAQWLHDVMIKPFFDKIGGAIRGTYDNVIAPAIRLATGAFDDLGKAIKKVYEEWVEPWMKKIGDKVDEIAKGFGTAFQTAVGIIGLVWRGVMNAVAKPINWVIDAVYNNGIARVWNFVADKLSLPPNLRLSHQDGIKVPGLFDAFASGGIYPGYTPGRDVGVIGVSGGEAIMRPEWTKAVGPGYVHAANAAARSGGVDGVRRFTEDRGLPFLGHFDLGGIPGLDDLKSKGEEIVRGFAAKGAEALFTPVRAAVNQFPDENDWTRVIKAAPLRLIDAIIDWIKDDDVKQGGGPVIQNALEWAKTQAGKPYQWGGGGNPSWDCSGFMAGIQQKILGRKPGRLWTTFDFQGSNAPEGWELNKEAPFTVGVTNLGVGHMAGTLAGVNVESRGGDGVVVGGTARGSRDAMFYSRYGFTPSISAGFSGNAPTGLLAAWIAQALAATGTPPPNTRAAWMSGMATLVGRESGGNIFAINTTDSNAAAGNASRGLAQVIPTTFAAYRDLDLPNDIFNPVANLAASINYIKSRYGDIAKVQQANPNMDPKGYALGGVIPFRTFDSGGPLGPGLTLAYNGTGRMEQTYTAEVNRALLTLASRGAAPSRGSAAPDRGPLHIENYHEAPGGDARRTAHEIRYLDAAYGPPR